MSDEVLDGVDGMDDDPDGNTIPGGAARDVLAFLVRSVVEDPDAVQVDVDDSGSRLTFNVRVAPGDMGRVIGKRGRIAQAIRTVVRAAAARDGLEIGVEFLE